MSITFERATPTDAEAIVAVQIRAFHDDARLYPGVELGGPPGYDSVDATLAKIEQDDFYVIRADDQIIGGIVVFDEGKGHFHLDVLFVDPAHHNRGVGTQAMQFIEQTYSAARWSLDTPVYAVRNHHFYEKFGYIRVNEFDADGIRLFAYAKEV